MARLDPDAFARLLNERGTNKKRLADQTGLARNTIQSVAKGKHCHLGTLEKIAKALGASVEELNGVRPAQSEAERWEDMRKVGIFRLNVSLSTQMALNYQVAADWYGVTPDTIIHAAPLCFTLLAELSLQRRREAIAQFENERSRAAGFAHVPCVMQGLSQLEEALILERASIDARDLDGQLADPNDESEAEGAFSAFIRGLMKETGISEEDRFGEDAFESISAYALFSDHLSNITGNSLRAEFALNKRYATIQQLPKELRWAAAEPEDATARRVAWLESKVPEAVWQEEKAKWPKFSGNLADLLKGLGIGGDDA